MSSDEGLQLFLEDIDVQYYLQDASNMLIQLCATPHALDKSEFFQIDPDLKATEYSFCSPHMLEAIVKELAHLLYSPDDGVIFAGHCLHRTWELLYDLWIGIETHVPGFRVPKVKSRLENLRMKSQGVLLCVVLCFTL